MARPNDSFVYRSMLSVPKIHTYSMGLRLTTRDPENFGLLILEVADGTAGSLLAFLEHRLMSFSLTLQCSLLTFVALVCGFFTCITRCANSGSVLLFSDPARLARIRVGVRDT